MVHLGLRTKTEAELEEMLREGAGPQVLSPEGMCGATEGGCVESLQPFWLNLLLWERSIPEARCFESHPGLRVRLCGFLGWLSSFITALATICQTVSSWRVRGLSHLSLEELHLLQSVSCTWWLRKASSLTPTLWWHSL